jgi:3-dehydroquinate synthase
MKKITINLNYIQEEILIGENMLDEIKKNIFMRSYDNFLVIADWKAYHINVSYFESLFSYLKIPKFHVVFLKPKPQYKDLKHAQVLIKNLIKIKASRKTCILAIGGGYVGDLSGFVASIYMRGIDFIQISTTLMSQCDGIIGKVAVNLGKVKNLIGAFYSPRVMFCDISFLKSISVREQIYGLVEIWKHAIIYNDKKIIAEINQFLEKNYQLNYKSLIYFSLTVKKHYVEKDLYDNNGYHKALSLGHTIANILESNPFFRHGLAVFYGIIFESILAKNSSILGQKKYDEMMYTASLFEMHFKQLQKIKNILKKKRILRNLRFDKINSHGIYSFVVPSEDGYFIYKNVSIDMINKTLNDFLKIALI